MQKNMFHFERFSCTSLLMKDVPQMSRQISASDEITAPAISIIYHNIGLSSEMVVMIVLTHCYEEADVVCKWIIQPFMSTGESVWRLTLRHGFSRSGISFGR